MRLVNRRFSTILVHVLLAAQLLLGAPAVDALVDAAPAAASAHCADMAPDAGASDPCPCCPDSTDMSSCLSSCLGTPGAMHAMVIAPLRRMTARPSPEMLVHLTARTDPPLKPPPIV